MGYDFSRMMMNKNPWEISGTTRLVVDLNGLQKNKLASVSGLCWCLAFSKSRQGSKEVATEGHKVVAFLLKLRHWGEILATTKGSRPRISRSPRSNFQVTWLESA